MVTVTILPRSVRSFGSNRPHAHARRPLSPPRTLLALFTAAIVGVVALNVYQNFDALLMFVFLLFAAAMAACSPSDPGSIHSIHPRSAL